MEEGGAVVYGLWANIRVYYILIFDLRRRRSSPPPLLIFKNIPSLAPIRSFPKLLYDWPPSPRKRT
jgi:hypothetical protein